MLEIGISLILTANLFSQGLPRSTGLGIRAGFYKPKDPSSGVYVGPYTSSTVSGTSNGEKYTFFSRVKGNWFLEAGFGTDEEEKVSFTKTGVNGSITGKSEIRPFLFGCRYDWLSPQYSRFLLPYVSGGAGLYWIKNNLVISNVHEIHVSNESQLKPGIYLGTGVHIVLKSWFALNGDLKYHFVNIQPGKGYSGFQFGIGCCFLWGKKRQMFHVEDIKIIVNDVYPAYYSFYQTYPLALVFIKNTVSYPIEINVRSEIRGYSERKYESGFIRIQGGETKDIPVYAVFGPKLLETVYREPAVIDFEVEARIGVKSTRILSEQIMIHHRNAWNGEIDKLGLFVTPDDEMIMKIGRRVATLFSTRNQDARYRFSLANELFNELKKMEIRYLRDPNIPFYKDDRVQFAGETADLKTGDCDDLVVLYASLLVSAGIHTAFVDVQDPTKEVAHVYLMFDTGLSPEQSDVLGPNEKRLVIHETSSGQRTVWIPVETTLVEEGFEAAWRSGAHQYLQEGVVRNGIAQGWVKIIEVE